MTAHDVIIDKKLNFRFFETYQNWQVGKAAATGGRSAPCQSTSSEDQFDFFLDTRRAISSFLNTFFEQTDILAQTFHFLLMF